MPNFTVKQTLADVAGSVNMGSKQSTDDFTRVQLPVGVLKVAYADEADARMPYLLPAQSETNQRFEFSASAVARYKAPNLLQNQKGHLCKT